MALKAETVVTAKEEPKKELQMTIADEKEPKKEPPKEEKPKTPKTPPPVQNPQTQPSPQPQPVPQPAPKRSAFQRITKGNDRLPPFSI
jgi:hypothetical protein